MSDIVADLHVHTTASDGQLGLPAALEVAREIGLTAIGITDHDRVHPDLADPVNDVRGLEVVRGIELRVERSTGPRIDLLGYGVARTADLDALLDRLQRDRIDRAERMTASVEAHLDIELELEPHPTVGRPHIARAIMAHPAIDMDERQIFEKLIGDGRPCYVPRDIPTYEEGVAVLQAAAQVVAVAHPQRYPDLDDALDAAIDLGAIERWYPYANPVDDTPIEEAIGARDLLPTGGSDAHDRSIGRAGLDASAYRRVRRRLRTEGSSGRMA